MFESLNVTGMSNTPCSFGLAANQSSTCSLEHVYLLANTAGGLDKEAAILAAVWDHNSHSPTLFRSQRSRENKPAANIKHTVFLSGRITSTMISAALGPGSPQCLKCIFHKPHLVCLGTVRNQVASCVGASKPQIALCASATWLVRHLRGCGTGSKMMKLMGQSWICASWICAICRQQSCGNSLSYSHSYIFLVTTAETQCIMLVNG